MRFGPLQAPSNRTHTSKPIPGAASSRRKSRARHDSVRAHPSTGGSSSRAGNLSEGIVDVFLQQLFNGLSLGSILLLVALGLAFTFGLMGVINMAHGELIMIGAYMPYVLQQTVGGAPNDPLGLTFLVSIPVAFGVTALIGVGMEWSLIRFLYGRPLDTLLATWGVGLVLQQAARTTFGAPNVQVVSPIWLNG